MQTTHLLAPTDSLELDSLQGFAYQHSSYVILDSADKIVSVRQQNKDKVQLLSAGLAPGLVGDGLLDAVVVAESEDGSVRSSQVEKALEKLSLSKSGSVQLACFLSALPVLFATCSSSQSPLNSTLLIIPNSASNHLQFGIAYERVKALNPEWSLELVVVGEDTTQPLSSSSVTLSGRRGLSGIVLAQKLAGAFATRKGTSLEEVAFLAKQVATRVGSAGAGVRGEEKAGDEPGEKAKSKDNDKASKNAEKGKADRKEKEEDDGPELEIGLGPNGENGVQTAPLKSASKLVDDLLTFITTTDDKDRNYLPFKRDGNDSVILLVANHGSLPELELNAIIKESLVWLKSKRITVERVTTSSAFPSSASPLGFTLSVLLLPSEPLSPPPSLATKTTFDKQLFIDLFDQETQASGWRKTDKERPEVGNEEEDEEGKKRVGKQREADTGGDKDKKVVKPTNSRTFINAIETASKAVISSSSDLDKYDIISSNFGTLIESAAEGVINKNVEQQIDENDVVQALVAISGVIEEKMGEKSTGGSLFSIFVASLSNQIGKVAKEQGKEVADAQVWSRALELSLNTLYSYSYARPPSRTFIDPLSAFVLTLSATAPPSFTQAFSSAKEASEATRSIEPKVGKGRALSDEEKAELVKKDLPDPGAFAVVKILEGIQQVLTKAKSEEETEQKK